MKDIKTNWSRDEFKAYALLYAIKSNQTEKWEEHEFILARVNEKTYQNIHHEIDKDNDYQSIQKIIYNIEKFEYSKEEIERLIDEIKQLFLADEDFDAVEQSIFIMLKRVLRNH